MALSGCIQAHYTEGNQIPWERASQIRPGVTTKADVLALFGAPQNFSIGTALVDFLEDQGLEPDATPPYAFADVFAYQMSRGKLRGYTVLVYTRVDLTIDSDLLVIFFGEDEIVSQVGVQRAEVEED
jgi:hypothetical protein